MMDMYAGELGCVKMLNPEMVTKTPSANPQPTLKRHTTNPIDTKLTADQLLSCHG